MNRLDLIVLSVAAAALAYPLIRVGLSKVVSAVRPSVPMLAENAMSWQQRWTNTLIELLSDLERDGKKEAAGICRDLMWEIIGGTSGQGKK